MNNAEVLNQQGGESGKGISVADIFYILRAHLLFIVIITLLFGVGGFAYAKVRKPIYTASVPVQFNISIISGYDDNGNEKINQSSSTTYLFRYIDTAVGICKSGEVLDRANVYYDYYLKSGMKIDAFINLLREKYETVKTSREEIPDYEVSKELVNKVRNSAWFTVGNVSTSYSSSGNTNETATYFKLRVNNLNQTYAREMARIYTLAADVSLNKILDFGTGTAGLIELIHSTSDVSVSSDMSSNRVVIVAVVLGLVVSLAVVYLKYLLDNTVKTKEQLEAMTGANVIAYLEDVAEVK